MKRILALTLMGILTTVIISSCGAKKKGSCDAYGSADQVENTDLAKK